MRKKTHQPLTKTYHSQTIQILTKTKQKRSAATPTTHKPTTDTITYHESITQTSQGKNSTTSRESTTVILPILRGKNLITFLE